MFLISIGVFSIGNINNLMTGINGKKLSPKEFNGYFKDVLRVLVKNTFNPHDELLFVTYQPDTLILDPNLVNVNKVRNPALTFAGIYSQFAYLIQDNVQF